MDLGLAGARALVFGSSSGMGRAIAVSLAQEGAQVFVTGRDEERVNAVADDVGAAGSAVADITSGRQAARVVESAVDAMGGLDILVGNTGGGRPGGLVDASEEDFDAGYERMLRPQLVAIRAAIPHLRNGGNGRIVVLTARSIVEASPDLALSSVFRSGVAAAVRSLALELAPDVRANVVIPGRVDSGALHRFEQAIGTVEGESPSRVRDRHITEIPLQRLAEPSEVGDLVAYLVSERARYITGSVFRIDGGLTTGF